MPTVHFVLPTGEARDVDAPEGVSAMQAALNAGIEGIVAECGGSAMCATCHVYVSEEWLDRLPRPLANENEMLECTASERLPTSRLSCQLKLSAALSGIVLQIPPSQQ